MAKPWRDWTPEQRANRIKYQHGWVSRNPERAAAITQRYKAKHPERVTETYLRARLKKYGLSLEAFREMELAQGGVCAICGDPPNENERLTIDHCHKTNNIRSLLCGKCNAGLGFFRDNTDFLQAAINYLEQRRKTDDRMEAQRVR